MARSLIRRTEWAIAAAVDETGEPVSSTRTTGCRDCPEHSGPVAQYEGDAWAMRHAARTGHREFVEISTARLTARPAA
ncbi:hypothetical protein AB0J21_05270 [Streptomyces sp. NPDC049954]|uniref:DUF7848 domain-containing protein n=1 Tax=Streptomyces sp. NPDC049954 TaxID=3155779 RepID=UPI0034385550